MRFLIWWAILGLCLGSMVIERTGACRLKELGKDAVRVFLAGWCRCYVVGVGGIWSDIKRFSCSMFILLRLWQVMVFGGDFGDSMLSMRWMKPWPAIKGESDFENFSTDSVFFTRKRSSVVCDKGFVCSRWWVGSVETMEKDLVFIRFRKMTVSGLRVARGFGLKSPVITMFW